MEKYYGVGDLKFTEVEIAELTALMRSSYVSEGKYVKQFEQEYAKYVGTRFCVAFNSGTSSLMAGLHCLKHLGRIEAGSKIITTPLTYIATSNAIVNAGFEPVYVDFDLGTWGMDAEALEAELKKGGVGCVLPVYLLGNDCDIVKLKGLCDKYEVPLFEDACEATGTSVDGKMAGSFGLLSSHSFFVAHILPAGEMGCVCTDDAELADALRSVKANGRMCSCHTCKRNEGLCPHKGKGYDPRFTHVMKGYNFKTTEVCALMAVQQLRHVDEIKAATNRNFKTYLETIRSFTDAFVVPNYSVDCSYFAYPLILKQGLGFTREELCDFLQENRIATRPLFGCIPTQQPAYSEYKETYKDGLVIAEFYGTNGFYVGCHQYLSQNDILHVCEKIREFVEANKE